jgi:hypothetical protein
MGAGSGGNQYLLFHLGDRALGSVHGLERYWALQHRHPDGERWVELAAFASPEDARAAMASLVVGNHADAEELRVAKITIER